jgi:DNA-binding NtrC family response regulator
MNGKLESAGSILIVDDDPLVQMNHSDLLQDAGFSTLGAETVQQAWNILQSRSFDLIVCDHDLTDGKGIDLLKKASESGIRTPVIYLSAAQASVLEEAGNIAIVKKVLLKPVDKEQLLDAANKYIDKDSAEDKYPQLIGEEEREIILKNLDFSG